MDILKPQNMKIELNWTPSHAEITGNGIADKLAKEAAEEAENTVIILNIGTDRSEQTVQTQIRLLLMEQSDQGLLCLLFCLHLLNTILQCKIQLFQL